MSDLIDFMNTPLGGAVTAMVLSAAVRALPAPETNGNKFYLWLYNFTNTLLANFDKLQPRPTVPPPPSS